MQRAAHCAFSPSPQPDFKGTSDDVDFTFLAEELASRVLVEPVVKAISNSSQITFDYVALVTIASLLAGFGLATDNAVIIVASMLVSPIMGPILASAWPTAPPPQTMLCRHGAFTVVLHGLHCAAVTFGTLIYDWTLVWTGVKAEALGLFICVFVGGIIGVGLGSWAEHELFQWPNPQMEVCAVLPSLPTRRM